jgi:hypothetical protein
MERPNEGLQMMGKGPMKCKHLEEPSLVSSNMCLQWKKLNPRREGGQLKAIQRPPRTQTERKGLYEPYLKLDYKEPNPTTEEKMKNVDIKKTPPILKA